MRLRRAAAALILALGLLAATPGPAAARAVAAGTSPPGPPAAEAAWPVPVATVTSADGRTHFTDRSGRVLRPRGLNLGKTDTVTEERVAHAARAGFTLLRLNIQWERVEPRRGHYDTGYLRYLDRVLDWADRHRMLVLVDWHQDVYGPAFGSNGIPAWATRTDGLPFEPDPDDWFAGYFQPAVQAAFRHLYDDPDLRAAQTRVYAEVAAALRGHRSLLGYDLFNEPFGPIAGDPLDPGNQIAAAAELERGRLAAMYRRLIGAVRAEDPDAWLFVEPTVLVGQGVPTELPRFTDPRRGPDRLGYAPHYYDTAVESGADWDPAGGFVENYEAAVTGYPTAHRLPVLVGEWGPPKATTPGNAELIRRQVASMNGFAAGWAMWYDCRAPDGGGYCAHDADGTPAPGKEPAFAPYAPAVAGTPGAEHHDAATGTYTLTFTAGRTARHAWTTVTLPVTAFPRGAELRTSGGGPAVIRTAAGRAHLLFPGARPGAEVRVTATAR
ncbi:cellulase family glycosylhydrolase [Streptomyces pactum]|uniref:cellulase family glycosylhydrolase n=1 Tax=Streptomyces pactum TaxID=68249 RepID=UPI00370088FF